MSAQLCTPPLRPAGLEPGIDGTVNRAVHDVFLQGDCRISVSADDLSASATQVSSRACQRVPRTCSLCSPSRSQSGNVGYPDAQRTGPVAGPEEIRSFVEQNPSTAPWRAAPIPRAGRTSNDLQAARILARDSPLATSPRTVRACMGKRFRPLICSGAICPSCSQVTPGIFAVGPTGMGFPTDIVTTGRSWHRARTVTRASPRETSLAQPSRPGERP